MKQTYSNQPLENSMVIGDYYADRVAPEPDRCRVCGEEEFDMPRSHRGPVCSSCTRTCAICDDWLLGEPTVKDTEGAEAHKTCVEDAA